MLANIAGGNYHYAHCTFANYSQFFFRQSPSFVFSDNVEVANNDVIIEPIHIKMVNSLFWGDFVDELLFSISEESNLELYTSNNILKTSLEFLDTNDNQLSTNTDYMGFRDPYNYDFSLDSLSPAINMGIDIGIEIDLPGMTRDSLPDIGAFEFIPGN